MVYKNKADIEFELGPFWRGDADESVEFYGLECLCVEHLGDKQDVWTLDRKFKDNFKRNIQFFIFATNDIGDTQDLVNQLVKDREYKKQLLRQHQLDIIRGARDSEFGELLKLIPLSKIMTVNDRDDAYKVAQQVILDNVDQFSGLAYSKYSEFAWNNTVNCSVDDLESWTEYLEHKENLSKFKPNEVGSFEDIGLFEDYYLAGYDYYLPEASEIAYELIENFAYKILAARFVFEDDMESQIKLFAGGYEGTIEEYDEVLDTLASYEDLEWFIEYAYSGDYTGLSRVVDDVLVKRLEDIEEGFSEQFSEGINELREEYETSILPLIKNTPKYLQLAYFAMQCSRAAKSFDAEVISPYYSWLNGKEDAYSWKSYLLDAIVKYYPQRVKQYAVDDSYDDQRFFMDDNQYRKFRSVVDAANDRSFDYYDREWIDADDYKTWHDVHHDLRFIFTEVIDNEDNSVAYSFHTPVQSLSQTDLFNSLPKQEQDGNGAYGQVLEPDDLGFVYSSKTKAYIDQLLREIRGGNLD
jgi:hypothetical protein